MGLCKGYWFKLFGLSWIFCFLQKLGWSYCLIKWMTWLNFILMLSFKKWIECHSVCCQKMNHRAVMNFFKRLRLVDKSFIKKRLMTLSLDIFLFCEIKNSEFRINEACMGIHMEIPTRLSGTLKRNKTMKCKEIWVEVFFSLLLSSQILYDISFMLSNHSKFFPLWQYLFFFFGSLFLFK